MQLAAALRGSGNVMQRATEIACGDVKPGGMLAAASREQQGDMSIDAGLFPLIWPLHQASSKAGTSCQVGMAAGVNLCGATAAAGGTVLLDKCSACDAGSALALLQAALAHVAAARLELDVYRPTHILPFVPFYKLAVLSRSLLR